MRRSRSDKVPERHYWDRSRPTAYWRAYLARAGVDGGGLRRWQFWVWWSQPRTVRERLVAIETLLTAPLRTVKEARHLAKQSGEALHSSHGISAVNQVFDMLVLWVTAGLPPSAYYKYQLYLPERRASARNYAEEATRLLQVIARQIPPAPDDEVFTDKRAFEVWCQEMGIPCVMNLLEFSEGSVSRRAVPSLPAMDLFSKPTNLRAGIGVCLWRHEAHQGESFWREGEGQEALDADALESRLAAISADQDRPYVLQPCLKNHPAIAALGNGGLSTVRLMTTRSSPGESAKLLLAVLRIPVGDSIADNFDAGGIAVPVDLESGECGDAVRKRGNYPLQPVSRHPDTGAQIRGALIPYWPEAVALGLRAHNLLQSHMPVIGWDIAILPAGPILVESNHFPCGNLAQMPTGIPLGATDYAECVVSKLRAAFL